MAIHCTASNKEAIDQTSSLGSRFLTVQVPAKKKLTAYPHLRNRLKLRRRSDTLEVGMTDPQPARRYRFGAFEADTAVGELRKQGIRIKLNAQPFQILVMLLERPGELLTREEISKELWPGGTYVDYEHGVNSAVNRIREALGDTAGNPRFVETLARRGYRFIAPVSIAAEQIAHSEEPQSAASTSTVEQETPPAEPNTQFLSGILSTPDDLPKTSHPVVQTLFVLLQLMYLAFYIGALANLAEIEDLLSSLPKATQAITVIIVTAGVMIPVRAFVLSMVLFYAPGARQKFLKIWPLLLLLDTLWALSPFLLLHHISFGLALSCTALLLYSPFAQRSLVLMGAGNVEHG
jgi:cholera toxin transcriptional activator